jgi:hypothetical protein
MQPFCKIHDEDSPYFGQIGMFEDYSVINGTLKIYYYFMPDNTVQGFYAYQFDSFKPSVLFLDIDGVCNSAEYATSGRHPKGQMLGFDEAPTQMVRDIIKDTGCLVVLSSTWRLNKKSREEVREQGINFSDVTVDFRGDQNRGAEIQWWLAGKEQFISTYAILDDDDDMMPYQKPNFFKTTWAKGLTKEIAQAVTEHLNGN